jgi:hypothetical protein
MFSNTADVEGGREFRAQSEITCDMTFERGITEV